MCALADELLSTVTEVGLSVVLVANFFGMSSSNIYAWQKNGVPTTRKEQVKEFTKKIKELKEKGALPKSHNDLALLGLLSLD